MDFLPRLGTVTSGFALLVSMLALLKQEVCKQQVCVRVQDKGKRWWNAGTWGQERRGRQTGPGQLLLRLHTQGLPGQGPLLRSLTESSQIDVGHRPWLRNQCFLMSRWLWFSFCNFPPGSIYVLDRHGSPRSLIPLAGTGGAPQVREEMARLAQHGGQSAGSEPSGSHQEAQGHAWF